MRVHTELPRNARSGLVAALILVSMALSITTAQAATADDVWTDLREMLFEERPVLDGAGVISLEAPYRAHDAAIVPITIGAEIPQTHERYIKSITLVIDQNPSPVAAVFKLTLENGTATIKTRVRIDKYTHVRAVAETNDGSLYMATKFIKAAGGCSSPALKDEEEAMARLGKMKLKQSTPVQVGESNEVQLLISHPNHSGLQRDPLTLYYIPAHFVQDVTVSYGGKTIMEVEGAISISEDPSFHFSYVPQGPGEFAVEVRDTEDQVFTRSWQVKPEAGS